MSTVTATTYNYSIKAGDLLPNLPITLQDQDGTGVDLSSVTTIVMRYRLRGSNIAATVKTGLESMVTDAPNGVLDVTWVSGETDTAGEYEFTIKATFSGATRTFPSNGYSVFLIDEPLGI